MGASPFLIRFAQNIFAMSLNNPLRVIEIAENAAETKLKRPFGKLAVAGILAGVYIAMGGTLSLIVGYGFPEITAANPAMQRLLSGAMFPLGLILVVFAGAELFTGNNAVLIPGLMNRRYGIGAVLRNWVIVYFCNFIGVLFFAYAMVYKAGLLSGIWKDAIVSMAEIKTSMPWSQVFLRGIGANWFVCLAVWLGFASQSAAGKIIGLWFPVMCFVALGYEHSIANMFFIPLGMMCGAEVSIADFVIDNLIPATLGNIVGGALFVGFAYWYLSNSRSEK